MTMLKSGWVIVGSTPSHDGTTATLGAGCLIVIDPNGKPLGALVGAQVDGPWGNMAWVDHGSTATLFVSNAGIDVGPATDDSPVVNKANVLRLELAHPGRAAAARDVANRGGRRGSASRPTRACS